MGILCVADADGALTAHRRRIHLAQSRRCSMQPSSFQFCGDLAYREQCFFCATVSRCKYLASEVIY